MRKLPPLNLFAVFECAARHLSFTKAAKELNIQQPAVSRQVAALEAELGTKLFTRSKPRLKLTPDGQSLQSAVATSLVGIGQCVAGIHASQRRNVLVVNAAIGFASLYLMPRLGAFQAANQDVALELVTRDQNTGFDAEVCDVVISFGETGLPDTVSGLVLQEELYALCAPSLLGHRGPLPPEDLTDQRLLHLTSPEHAGDWKRFLDGIQQAAPPSRQLDHYYSFMVYLHAIQNGNGFGLGWSGLTDELVASGRLALACDRRVQTNRGYYCCIMPHTRNPLDADNFLEWMTSPY